jgi:2,3-bisphosphoglycerate-dependent phosphoglycerate mutase
LLRHGQSVGNAEGYYQGQSDFPLNDTGIQQAQALARRWQVEGVAFDQIISSPLARAHQTALILAETLGGKVELEPDWMERNNGRLAGMRPEQAAELYPRPAFMHPYHPIGETGESQMELYLRAGRAVNALLRRPPGRILVVSHGGILNMVMYAILGIALQANFHGPRFRFRNTAFARLTYHPAQHIWHLETLNDRAHWKSTEG